MGTCLCREARATTVTTVAVLPAGEVWDENAARSAKNHRQARLRARHARITGGQATDEALPKNSRASGDTKPTPSRDRRAQAGNSGAPARATPQREPAPMEKLSSWSTAGSLDLQPAAPAARPSPPPPKPRVAYPVVNQRMPSFLRTDSDISDVEPVSALARTRGAFAPALASKLRVQPPPVLAPSLQPPPPPPHSHETEAPQLHLPPGRRGMHGVLHGVAVRERRQLTPPCCCAAASRSHASRPSPPPSPEHSVVNSGASPARSTASPAQQSVLPQPSGLAGFAPGSEWAGTFAGRPYTLSVHRFDKSRGTFSGVHEMEGEVLPVQGSVCLGARNQLEYSDGARVLTAADFAGGICMHGHCKPDLAGLARSPSPAWGGATRPPPAAQSSAPMAGRWELTLQPTSPAYRNVVASKRMSLW